MEKSVEFDEEEIDNNHRHRPLERSSLALESSTNKRNVDMQQQRRILTSIGADNAVDDDDYSTSVCAIMQRRNSSRRHSRRRRRTSSPFSPDMDSSLRRRSSAFTTSSGDTAISMDDGGEEQIFEKLRLHKEVLSGVKQQPWPLRRKLKLVRQAKAYVRKHEGVLQERLAQSRSTRDVIARASILISKKWQYLKRELVNLQTWLIPWELRIKEIESHFGSAVASYFTFLRWLFWINFVISATLAAFVALPEILTADVALAGERKTMLPEEKAKSKHLLTLWEFEGVLKYSPFFYGWYTNKDTNRGYRLPLAYFIANLVVYTYSFVAILRKMAENSRMSKLSEKEDECAFSWKLFTGWDFMIGNPETAHNRIASIVLGFKEALLEEAEKEKDERNWKITVIRIFVNISVISLLALSAYAVVEVVARSTQPEADSSWWRQNEITVVMSLITYIFPIFFEILGIFENYHPRKQLRMQLARIMVLNLLNLYSLIFALFDKISHMEVQLRSLRPRSQKALPSVVCHNMPISCESNDLSNVLITLASFSLVLMPNLTASFATLIPEVTTTQQDSTIPFSSSSNTGNSNSNNNGSSIGVTESFQYLPFLENSTITPDIYYSYDDDGPHLDYEYYDDVNIENWTLAESTMTTATMAEITVTTMTQSSTTMDTTAAETTATSSPDLSLYEIKDKDIYTNLSDVTGFTGEEKLIYETSPSTLDEDNENNKIARCYQRICEKTNALPENIYDSKSDGDFSFAPLDIKTRRKLRKLCWETMFGQELAKLTVMDLVLTIISTLGMDFFRALFVRFMNNCWCWDLEKQFPQYGDFKIAENILHLVNNQGMVWMGMFFSPGLTALNLVKLGILMYLRSWAVLTCNVPHEVVFRASRSNNFYLALLLTMLFLCVLPVGYAIVWVEPSWHCGPFSNYRRIYYLATKSLKNALPKSLHKILDYIASPGIIIPLIVLMALIIYYMVSLTGSLREANNDLKIQLRQERIEERRKMFKIAEKRQEIQETPFARWKKILPGLQSKSHDGQRCKDLVESIVALGQKERKGSITPDAEEATETEQDSLPHDHITLQDKDKEYKIIPKASPDSTSNNIVQHNYNDSLESNEYNMIPEIRISLTENTSEPESPYLVISESKKVATNVTTNT